MRRRAKLFYVIAATVLTIAAAFGWMSLRPNDYEKLVHALPSPLRLAYLNHIFDNPTEDCAQCYTRFIGALQALDRNRQMHGEDYGFDYARLLPLLRQGPDEIREPVPGSACYLILVRHDARIYRAMVQMFRHDQKSLRFCIENGPLRLGDRPPAEYELARMELLKLPEISAYVEKWPRRRE